MGVNDGVSRGRLGKARDWTMVVECRMGDRTLKKGIKAQAVEHEGDEANFGSARKIKSGLWRETRCRRCLNHE